MTRPVFHLPDDLRRVIVDHCQSEVPNEACGLMAVDDGEVVKVYPCRNLDASSTSYTVAPDDHYRALMDAEAQGWRLGGVYHSHPHGSAEMSDTDRKKALEPDWVYVVVGLGGREPELSLNQMA